MRRLALVAAAFATLALAPTAHAWTWPASGEVLKPFVYGGDPYAGGQHSGIDVSASRPEESVLAPASGVVSFAGTVGTNGKVVTFETPRRPCRDARPARLDAVRKGDVVREGAVVGSIGPSGTPEHEATYVHLGIRVATDPHGYIDPLTLLPPRAAPAPPPPPHRSRHRARLRRRSRLLLLRPSRHLSPSRSPPRSSSRRSKPRQLRCPRRRLPRP